ncbi:MAG: nucleotidyltransferase family protein [Rhizobiaceae bacterium]
MSEGGELAPYVVKADAKLYDAMVKINDNASHGVFVVDEGGRLAGSITDGDIRRTLISGRPDLNRPVLDAMNPSVRYLAQDATEREQQAFMRRHGIDQLPIVAKDGSLARVILSSTLYAARRRNTPVLIMAGGLGSRLGELTRDKPKPLVTLNDKPIAEHVVEKFVDEGFRRFFISINHMGDKVKEYFGDGSRYGANVSYVEETKKLGTAGAISLIADREFENLFVINCDIICGERYGDILDFHDIQNNGITIGVANQTYLIPFGVVDTVSHTVTGFREKPVHQVSVNTGIYVLERSLLGFVPKDTKYDMPELLQQAIANDFRCAAYEIKEEWIDVGRPEELRRAEEYLQKQAANRR